jgi:hypothetical protein
MNNAAPLAISGWQTLGVTVLAVLVALVYGEWRARDAVRRPPMCKHRPRRTHPSASPTGKPKSDIREEEDTVVIRDG